MSIRLPFLPLEVYPPTYHLEYLHKTTLETLNSVNTVIESGQISNFPITTHEIYAFPLAFLAFIPIFLTLRFSTNSKNFGHRIHAGVISLYLLVLPAIVRPTTMAGGWLFSALCWLLAHKVILWLITDFDVFRYNIIRKYEGSIKRQIWEYVKMIAEHRTGIPKAWSMKNDNPQLVAEVEQKKNMNETTIQSNGLRHRKSKTSVNVTSKPCYSSKTAQQYWSIQTPGPEPSSVAIRGFVAALLAYCFTHIPTSAYSTTLFTIQSIKTNFILLNFIWTLASFGWDMGSLIIRFAVSQWISMHQFVYPNSELLKLNPKENQLAWYVQYGLNFITSYNPMFHNIWNFQSVGHFWGQNWHQNFKSVFSELIYKRIIDFKHPSTWNKFLALCGAFISSAFLHEYMVFVISGPKAATFEQSTFFLIQPFFIISEHIFERSKWSKYSILRLSFRLAELYLLLSTIGLFFKYFIDYDLHRSMGYAVTSVDFKRIDQNAAIPLLLERWLRSESVFG